MVSERWSVFSRTTWETPFAAACAAALSPAGPEPTIAILNLLDDINPPMPGQEEPHVVRLQTPQNLCHSSISSSGTTRYHATLGQGEHKVHGGGSWSVCADPGSVAGVRSSLRSALGRAPRRLDPDGHGKGRHS